MSTISDRLRWFADIEDSGGGSCDLQFETSPSREAADLIDEMVAAMEFLLEWDAQRGYPVPYKVRDPIHNVLARARKEQP